MTRRPLLRTSWFCALLLAGIALGGGTLAFADGPTVVPDNKDADYAIIGEFVGPVETAPRKYEPLALQVRSMGGGAFEALQYLGGLPGEKGHKQQRTSLLGQRSGDFLVLSGGPWALLVHHDHAVVVNQRGDRIGRLERVVRGSPTLGAKPPKDAIVIFNGEHTDHFTKAQMTGDGLLMQGADFKPMFQDYNLHLEFLLPYKPGGRGQDRGNSGVYLQSRYEVQILDSFAEPPTSNGLGGLYRYREPDVNLALPPSTWQTYDIAFTAPRWAAGGEKIRNARITVWLNGVKIHDDVELENKTGAGKQEEPTLLPTRLQDHGNPVRFRNIWVIDRGLSPAASFPVYPPKPAPPEEKPQPAKEKQPAPAKPEDQPQRKASKQKADKPEPPGDKQPEAKDAKAEAKPAEAKDAEKKEDATRQDSKKDEAKKDHLKKDQETQAAEKKAAPARKDRPEAAKADKKEPQPADDEAADE